MVPREKRHIHKKQPRASHSDNAMRNPEKSAPANCAIATHALKKWQNIANNLNLDPSAENLHVTLKKAVPEKPKNNRQRFHLFKRNILQGSTSTFTADGWRFVIADSNNKCVTIERVKPHENFFR